MNKTLLTKRELGGYKTVDIYVLNGEFNDSEMNELYNNPKIKAMVSLTKGEGFGRPLLEIRRTGKPVIASWWSGQVDFLHNDHSILLPGELEPVDNSATNNWLIKESKWFKPDTRYVGQIFRDTFKNPKEFQTKAKRQKYYTQKNFSWNHMKELVGTILENNLPTFAQQIKLNLPELNLPKLWNTTN